MKKVKVIVFALLLISFLNISCGPFGGYGGYSNKKRSSCLFYDGKIIGFDFSKVQNQEMGRSYIPLYIKLNKNTVKITKTTMKALFLWLLSTLNHGLMLR